MYNLKIFIASTRNARKGPFVANWIFDKAKQHSEFETELIDLKEINLPFFDEPEHPMHGRYTNQHTRDWSARINPADAFIIVTPEYNFGFTAPMKNALDYLYNEWSNKPVALVSYGGISAGTRAVQMLKLVVDALKMIAVPSCISIPFFTKFLDKQNNFIADERLNKSAEALFKDLLKWTEFLKNFREKEELILNGHSK